MIRRIVMTNTNQPEKTEQRVINIRIGGVVIKFIETKWFVRPDTHGSAWRRVA